MLEDFQNHFIPSFMECFITLYNQTYIGELSLGVKIATSVEQSVYRTLRA